MTTRPDRWESANAEEKLLLHSRMKVLALDVDGWARFEPLMIDRLRTACATCASPERCAHDLAAYADDPDWPDWRDYCPNAAKLNMLIALQFSLVIGEPPQ